MLYKVFGYFVSHRTKNFFFFYMKGQFYPNRGLGFEQPRKVNFCGYCLKAHLQNFVKH